MDKGIKDHPSEGDCGSEKELMHRRGFLLGLKKWSKIVIGGALLGGTLLTPGVEKEAEGAAWANRAGGGGAWANRSGGGGAWANHAGGGGAWANRGGGSAAWANRGVAWVNRF